MRYAISVSATLHAPSIAFDESCTTDTIGRHDNIARIRIESSLLIEQLALKLVVPVRLLILVDSYSASASP